MTISSTDRVAGPFTGDDLTTVFAFTFKVFDEDELLVVRLTVATGVEETLVLTTDYTVSLNADQNVNPGGEVTLGSALATGTTLTITSDADQVQETDLQNQGGFYPNVIEDALDRGTIIDQQIQAEVDRCLKLPLTSESESDLPAPVADTLIGFDDSDPPELMLYTGANIAALIPEDVDLMVLCSADDNTAAFLEDKLVAGTSITLTTLNPGANETVEISVDTTIPSPASATPLVDSGAGAVGTGTTYARHDHVHPVNGGSTTPLEDAGTGSAGSSGVMARDDHVHPAPVTCEAFDENDATPSVASRVPNYRTANTSPTVITSFSDMANGQTFVLEPFDSLTTVDGGLTATGMSIPLALGDFLVFHKSAGGVVKQIGGNVGMGQFVPLNPQDVVGDWISITNGTTWTDVDFSDDGGRAGMSAVMIKIIGPNPNTVFTLYGRKNGSSASADETTSLATFENGKYRRVFAVVPVDDSGIAEFSQSASGVSGTFTAALAGYWI